jgi:hypothetical protein
MRVPAVIVLMLIGAAGLGGCVPDVMSLEAVPTPRFSRDLAQCNAAANDALPFDDSVRRCMRAKGYRFLRHY